MATRLQLRKGTTAEHSTFVGAVGEVTVDTTKKTLVLHDGVTAGGKPLPTLEGGKVPLSQLPQLPDATTSTKGVVQLATQGEVNVGTNNTKAMTPNTLGDGVRTLLNASGSAPIYACRAWVFFDATSGTPVIRASGNVSSITDKGVGNYVVNFTTAMQDAHYAASALCKLSSSDVFVNEVTRTTSKIELLNKSDDAGAVDCEVSVTIVR